jgi:methyl halide transferase
MRFTMVLVSARSRPLTIPDPPPGSDFFSAMDWNHRYHQNDIPWDKGAAHPWLPSELVGPAFAGRILVPGCGRGWDAIELAGHCPAADVIALDIAAAAIAEARRLGRDLPNLHFLEADFLDPLAAGLPPRCDLIWEHTCFCAIAPASRPAYVATCARLLPPGGILAGAFFLELDDGGKGPPWNCPAAELRRLFEPAFGIVSLDPAPATFAGREGEEFLVRMTRR